MHIFALAQFGRIRRPRPLLQQIGQFSTISSPKYALAIHHAQRGQDAQKFCLRIYPLAPICSALTMYASSENVVKNKMRACGKSRKIASPGRKARHRLHADVHEQHVGLVV